MSQTQIALEFGERESTRVFVDARREQFKFKPSRSPFVPPPCPSVVSPGWDFGKKRGLSVESHRGPVGWLLGQEGHSREADVPHCWPCLYNVPVAAALASVGAAAAQLNVWRLTLSAALLVCLLPTAASTKLPANGFEGSLPNLLPTSTQIYTATAQL